MNEIETMLLCFETKKTKLNPKSIQILKPSFEKKKETVPEFKTFGILWSFVSVYTSNLLVF